MRCREKTASVSVPPPCFLITTQNEAVRFHIKLFIDKMASDNDGGGDDWCTIESDPGVFTELLETLGCEHVQLEELWTLEDDSLQNLRDATDNQVYGLIFLFQWGHGKQPERPQSAPGMSTANDIPEDLFFAHQVTTNACATQAILSVVLNATTNDSGNDSPSGLQLGKVLSEFQSFTKDFPPPQGHVYFLI
jgi:ubiquitin carboxyl-terminal hydrolase L5